MRIGDVTMAAGLVVMGCVFAVRTARLWLLVQLRDHRRPVAVALALGAVVAVVCVGVGVAMALGSNLSALEPLLGAVRRPRRPPPSELATRQIEL
jgi:hypothetical protein